MNLCAYGQWAGKLHECSGQPLPCDDCATLVCDTHAVKDPRYKVGTICPTCGTCIAKTGDNTRCKDYVTHAKGAAGEDKLLVCDGHAGLYDEYATIVGEDVAMLRIVGGKAACGDLEEAARKHALRVVAGMLDDAGFNYTLGASA